MDPSINDMEIHKLSLVMSENDEIILDINNMIKELKTYKEIDQITYESCLTKCNDLMIDIDDIISVLEKCQKENDPIMKSFDSNKKSSIQKANKSKKLLEQSIEKLAKLLNKNAITSSSKNKGILKTMKKDNDKKMDEVSKSKDNLKVPKDTQEETPDSKLDMPQKEQNKFEILNSPRKEFKSDEKIDDDNNKEHTGLKKNAENKNIKKHGFFRNSSQKKEKDKMNNEKSQIDNDEIDKNSSLTLENNQEIQKNNLENEHNSNNEDGENSSNKNMITKENVIDSDLKPFNSKLVKSRKHKNLDKQSDINNDLEKQQLKIQNKNKKDKKINKLFKTPAKENETNIKNENELTDYTNDLSKISTTNDENNSKKNNSKLSKESHVENKDFEDSSGFLNETLDGRISKDKQNLNPTLLNTVDSSSSEIMTNIYVVIKDFNAEENDDLTGFEGEELLLLEATDVDWCYARNNKGKEGYVPTECLKKKSENNQTGDVVLFSNSSESMYVTKENNGDIINKNQETNLWSQIKQSMPEKTITELLKSCGNLPPGFRYSTLRTWMLEDSNISNFVAYLCPKLSDSHLSYCELQFNQIRPHPIRNQNQIKLIKLVQVPNFGDKFIVKSRHVRICIFNGNKAVSNIHTMRAYVNEKDLKTWNFVSKFNDTTKSLDYNEIFVRLNDLSIDFTILMEFCILGFKTKQTSTNATDIKVDETFSDDELIELSIGWTTIPLYENNNQFINNKKAEFWLKGGTPFEKDVEIDPDIYKTDGNNQIKQTQITIQFCSPNKESKDLLESLPSMIIGSTLDLIAYSFYRRILADEILDCHNDLTSAKPIYSLFLVSFTETAQYSDFFDILRVIWNEKLKTIKSIQKKDYRKMNEIFKSLYMDYIYPLSKLKNLPNFNLARPNLEQIRFNMINEFILRIKKDHISILLTDEYEYIPFTFSELNFHVSPNSTAIQA